MTQNSMAWPVGRRALADTVLAKSLAAAIAGQACLREIASAGIIKAAGTSAQPYRGGMTDT